MNKALKVLMVSAGVLAGLICVLMLTLVLISPGTVAPIRGSDGKVIPGSVGEIVTWEIGGVPQVLIIRGWNRRNPVLLFLHGGPGSPEYPFYKMACADLEKRFTVVNWEQRGSGKSYSKKILAESMNVEQFVKDTIEISEKLKTEFGQAKIFLLGHSWGSAIGLLAAQRRPDLYRAYAGVAQAVNFIEGEKLAYRWVMEEARKRNHHRALEELEEIGPPPYFAGAMDKKAVEMRWVVKFGGGFVHDTKGLGWRLAKAFLGTGEYTFRDKINYFKGVSFSLNAMIDQIMDTDMKKMVPSLAVPVHILQGEFDYQVSRPLTEDFFRDLKAPFKKYHFFADCSHGAMFEKPALFLGIMTNEVIRH